ncbi:MAG TPA: LytTR family DNA-binding domain-containing protein [Fulvivirga sp.]|nr:LytTR family DNA-binding domain-containing protein [Fulvivirga sp.]
MKIALIDDENAVRATIKSVIEYYFKEAEIKEAGGVEEGLKLLADYNPDLLFLDIEMDDGTGFDLLTRCLSLKAKVVFVTAHDGYAVKAFKFSALDYLLKPINPEEIKEAVIKAKDEAAGETPKIDSFLYNWNEGELKRIVLSDLSSIHVVELNEIIRCQSVNNYTHFYLTEGRELVISITLKHYDELLTNDGFFRVHQSHIINLNYLRQFSKKDGGEIILKDGTVIPVSSRKKEGLIDFLKSLKS